MGVPAAGLADSPLLSLLPLLVQALGVLACWAWPWWALALSVLGWAALVGLST